MIIRLQSLLRQRYSLIPEHWDLMAEGGQDGFELGDQVGRWGGDGCRLAYLGNRCCSLRNHNDRSRRRNGGPYFNWQFGHDWSLYEEFRNPCDD